MEVGTSPLELPDQVSDPQNAQDETAADETDQAQAADETEQVAEESSQTAEGGNQAQSPSGDQTQQFTEPGGQNERSEKNKGGKSGNGKVDPSLRLINTAPLSAGQDIDEPVTSGGDVVIGDTPGGAN